MRAHDAGRAVRDTARTLLAGALVAILALTLSRAEGEGGVNLIPFRGIVNELGNINSELGMLNLAGNVLMFVPVGLIAPLALRWGVGRVVTCAFALSVAIEGIQLVLGRSSDVDDVILNTLGALIGAAITCSVMGLVGRRAPRTELHC